MRELNEIIVHCTATPAGWRSEQTAEQKTAEVKRWHVTPKPDGRGWSDIGYHYLVDRDGTVVEGRPLERNGAHVLGHNTGTIGIALFGGKGGASTDHFNDNFTQEQNAALRSLINTLKQRWGITKLSGHNEYAAKACPCFDVRTWYNRKQPRTSIAQASTMQAGAVAGVSTVATGVTAVSALDGHAQTIAVIGAFIVLVALAWIMRERLKRWARGDR